MIIKNLRTLILGIITLFTIYLYFLSANANTPTNTIKIIPSLHTEKEEQQALAYLNSLRQGAGLIPFSSQLQLHLAANNHANYLIKNNTFGHHEEHNKSSFTGAFASQRIVHTGYHTPLVIENVSSHNRNYKESIDGLMAAIYHRFAFLDFQGDEIGISVKQNSFNKLKTAFVYNISSHALNQLYIEKKQPSKKALNEALTIHKNENIKVVMYPFNKQEDVPPVFFNELPDPLPNYDVSGFPVSISFNQAHFKNIRLLNFELFDNQGKLIKESRTHTHKSDPNRRLDKFSFVLFPLKRLEWNTTYSVKFLAIVDNKMVEKRWSFKTRNYKIPLHKVSNENQTIDVKLNEANIFYFPPKTAKDLLKNIRYSSKFEMEFIDKNTLKITALETSFLTTHLKLGSHKLKLNIQN
jgi:uncharacterized protein YkwD